MGTRVLEDAETSDARTSGHGDAGTIGDSRTWDAETRRRDKQTTPEFCTEFEIYNFR